MKGIIIQTGEFNINSLSWGCRVSHLAKSHSTFVSQCFANMKQKYSS